ncbi:phosphoribosylglycinamide formyltransferase [Caldiplasma sukawensis]
MVRHKIAVFASGSGTTFQSIVDRTKSESSSYHVIFLVTDREDCGAVSIAKNNGIDVLHYGNRVVETLLDSSVSLIVLAGFLKILKQDFIKAFNNRIVNIHPSLLPSFGGKGFYGMNVHHAVLRSGVKYTGFTVHLVREGIDDGPIVYQKIVPVLPGDTPEDLHARVHKYELQIYPGIIDMMLSNGYDVVGNTVNIM